MKYYVTTLLLLLISVTVCSQNPQFKGLQGVETPEGDFTFELRGYDIYITNLPGNIGDDRAINELLYKVGIDSIQNQYQDEGLNVRNRIVDAKPVVLTAPYLEIAQTCYLFEKEDNTLTAIRFLTMNQRNMLLEQAIVKEYLSNTLTPYLIKSGPNKSFDFAGRKIRPKTDWFVVGPHHVGSDGVDIRWWEFGTLQDAKTDRLNRIKLDKNDMEVLTEGKVSVLLENMRTEAYRIAYKDPLSEYPLIAYYVVHKLRNQYVSSILSNYGHNEDDYYLNPLIENIMRIPQLPENAFRLPEQESYYEDVEYVYEPPYEPANFMDFQLGARVPIGNLRNIYSSATVLGLYFKLFTVKSTMIDVGMQCGFPSGKGRFKYYQSRHNSDETEATVLLNLSARARWNTDLQSNYRLQYYIGLGYESLSTDISSGTGYDEYGNEINYTHAVRTMDFYGGINLKGKYMGLFLEYHITPYSIASKVDSNFGNSAVHMGVVVTF